MKSDPAKYQQFYQKYSQNIKEGVLEDAHSGSTYKDMLLPLLRWVPPKLLPFVAEYMYALFCFFVAVRSATAGQRPSCLYPFPCVPAAGNFVCRVQIPCIVCVDRSLLGPLLVYTVTLTQVRWG